MLASHGPVQDPGSIILIAFGIAAVVVVFWRAVIKLLIIGVTAVVVLGLYEFAQNTH